VLGQWSRDNSGAAA
jgi:hypothetical protein